MAELTIEYIRDTLSDGFYLGTNVLGAVDIDTKCLVARKGTGSTEEYISRIATLPDLEGIEEAPAGGYERLQESGFSGVTPSVGDQVVLHSVPSLWNYLGYVAGTFHDVTAWDPVSKTVRVNPVFPAYHKGLSFSLYSSGLSLKGSFTDSAASCLDIFGLAWADRMYYRLDSYDAQFDTLEAAINKYVSLKTQAQSLVDSTETYLDEYEGTDTEIYT